MQHKGMKTFSIIWFGQLVSWIGTAMTRFALLIWTYNQSNSATTVALLGFFTFTPYVLVSPLAGVWIDRLNRRLIMLWADLGAGIITSGLFVLYASGQLEIWHLFVAQALSGVFEAFQIPAFSAATTMLIPKEQYTRASGMRSIADSASTIIGPVLAGALITFIDINGIMLIDIGTFLVAMLTLLMVRIPNPLPRIDKSAEQSNVGQEMWQGFQYIKQRAGLLGLLMIFAGINFTAALTYSFGII